MPLADAFDLAHLDRQTAGDRDLQREVLALFRDQCSRMLARIGEGAAAGQWQVVANAAHTLKGAALGVGAQAVASAAAVLEEADAAMYARAIADLQSAVSAAECALEWQG